MVSKLIVTLYSATLASSVAAAESGSSSFVPQAASCAPSLLQYQTRLQSSVVQPLAPAATSSAFAAPLSASLSSNALRQSQALQQPELLLGLPGQVATPGILSQGVGLPAGQVPYALLQQAGAQQLTAPAPLSSVLLQDGGVAAAASVPAALPLSASEASPPSASFSLGSRVEELESAAATLSQELQEERQREASLLQQERSRNAQLLTGLQEQQGALQGQVQQLQGQLLDQTALEEALKRAKGDAAAARVDAFEARQEAKSWQANATAAQQQVETIKLQAERSAERTAQLTLAQAASEKQKELDKTTVEAEASQVKDLTKEREQLRSLVAEEEKLRNLEQLRARDAVRELESLKLTQSSAPQGAASAPTRLPQDLEWALAEEQAARGGDRGVAASSSLTEPLAQPAATVSSKSELEEKLFEELAAGRR